MHHPGEGATRRDPTLLQRPEAKGNRRVQERIRLSDAKSIGQDRTAYTHTDLMVGIASIDSEGDNRSVSVDDPLFDRI